MTDGSISFDGDVAIVTGAGAGIGRETALALAARGARVLVNDPAIDASGAPVAEKVVKEIRDAGGSAVPETSAVGSVEACERLVEAALDRFGQVDILVNNAAISRPGAFGTDSDEDIARVVEVNLMAPWRLMRAVWPLMQERGGRIVNTSSSAAMGSGISGAYAPTKAAIIGLTKEAAESGRRHGIRVNAIMPSAHTALLDKHPDAAFRAWMARHFPARLVAATTVFLASREADVSGEVFATRGGLVQRIAFFESRGFFDQDLTPETLREAFDTVMDVSEGHAIGSQADHGETVKTLFPA